MQISDNANGKPSSRISALAEQVFGVQSDENQKVKSTAGAPVSYFFRSIRVPRIHDYKL